MVFSVCLDQLSLVEVVASLFPPAALPPALREEPTDSLALRAVAVLGSCWDIDTLFLQGLK